jgi:hypothetical protein
MVLPPPLIKGGYTNALLGGKGLAGQTTALTGLQKSGSLSWGVTMTNKRFGLHAAIFARPTTADQMRLLTRIRILIELAPLA